MVNVFGSFHSNVRRLRKFKRSAIGDGIDDGSIYIEQLDRAAILDRMFVVSHKVHTEDQIILRRDLKTTANLELIFYTGSAVLECKRACFVGIEVDGVCTGFIITVPSGEQRIRFFRSFTLFKALLVSFHKSVVELRMRSRDCTNRPAHNLEAHGIDIGRECITIARRRPFKASEIRRIEDMIVFNLQDKGLRLEFNNRMELLGCSRAREDVGFAIVHPCKGCFGIGGIVHIYLSGVIERSIFSKGHLEL